MSTRELALFDRWHNVLDTNVHYAGRPKEPNQPTLRRRPKPKV